MIVFFSSELIFAVVSASSLSVDLIAEGDTGILCLIEAGGTQVLSTDPALHEEVEKKL